MKDNAMVELEGKKNIKLVQVDSWAKIACKYVLSLYGIFLIL